MTKKARILIAGGGLGGCFAAMQAVKAGLEAVLVERRTFLGREISAYGRGWLEGTPSAGASWRQLLPFGADPALPDTVPKAYRTAAPLFIGAVRKNLLRRLLDADVKVLLQSDAVGLAEAQGRAAGLLLANKYGLQLLKGDAVLDMTPGRAVLACLGGESSAIRPEALVRFVVELENVEFPPSPVLTPPEALGIESAVLRAGKKGKGSALIELAWRLPLVKGDLLQKGRIEAGSRSRAYRLVRWLRERRSGFEGARAVNIAYESYVEPSKKKLSSRLDGIYTIEKDLPWNFDATELGVYCDEITVLLQQLARTESVTPERILLRDGAVPISACRMQALRDKSLPVPLTSVTFDPQRYVRKEVCTGVLVAGGGTAGIMTALAARASGSDTLIVEYHPDFGGTRTQGLVTEYYHGYKGGATGRTDKKIADIAEQITGSRNFNNRVARFFYYNEEIQRLRCGTLVGAQICGALVSSRSIRGVLAASEEDGLFLVRADVTVDTTGDGDVAFFAGVPYSFGDPTDGTVQSYSMFGQDPQRLSDWRETPYKGDPDVINQENYGELLRGLYLGTLENSDYMFATMLTPREARHIRGEYTLTLEDVYGGYAAPDCIAVGLTNMDTHGIQSNLYYLLGLYPRTGDIPAQLPYRSCIPKGYSGLLVGAKAISATRDAACMLRMNADIQNAGYALGLAAAEAANRGCDVRAVDVGALQERLKALGILPDWAFTGTRHSWDDEEVRRTVALVAKGGEKALAQLLPIPHFLLLRALTEAYAAAEKRPEERLALARGLAWCGERLGSELLRQRLCDLEKQNGSAIKFNLNGEVDRLLVLLALANDRDALPDIIRVASHLTAGGPAVRQTTTYEMSKIDTQRIPNYKRVLCLSFALERLADERAGRKLEALLDLEYIGGYVSPSVSELHNYYSSYLELRFAAALARCGSRKAAGVLIAYLGDIHSILREYARNELSAISGGLDASTTREWENWLSHTMVLGAVPKYVGENLCRLKQ